VYVSITQTFRESVRASGHRVSGRPGLRLNLLGQTWLELEATAARQYFDAPLDDYWVGGPRLELGLDYGRKSSISLGYEAQLYATDNQPALDAEGNRLTATHRRLLQQDVRLSWRHHWDESRRWRTTAKLGARTHRDNGGGYFDYNRVLGSGEVRYRAAQWEISAGALAMHGAFPIQTVGGDDPRKRNRTEVRWTLTAERKLTRFWRVTATYEREEIWSNLTLDTYRVNTFAGGMGCEF
jgi:hypothetical protein